MQRVHKLVLPQQRLAEPAVGTGEFRWGSKHRHAGGVFHWETPIMKALSVRQPFAAFIAAERKLVELRSWSTNYRGPLLILASAQKHEAWDDYELTEPDVIPHLTRGVAICKVQLVDVRPSVPQDQRKSLYRGDLTGCFSWVLEDPVPVEQRPVKGRLMLFDVQGFD